MGTGGPNPETLTQIGRFRVVRPIGKSGSAWTYEVVEPGRLERRLALKLMKPELRMLEEDVSASLRSFASIEHPNLVRVHELGKDPGTDLFYETMELVEGTDLDGVTPRSLGQLGGLFLDVLAGLSQLHEAGVLHCSIKPSNILVSEKGVAKLADSWSARDARAQRTPRPYFAMSPRISAPEQIRGAPPVPQTDLFALGVTLYWVLTGHSVYDALGDLPSPIEVIGHLELLRRSGKEFRLEFPREIPVPLRKVVARACRISPDKRFQSASEMRCALEAALHAEQRTWWQRWRP